MMASTSSSAGPSSTGATAAPTSQGASSSSASSSTPSSRGGSHLPPPLLISPGGTKGDASGAAGTSDPGASTSSASNNPGVIESLISKHTFPEELDRCTSSVTRDEHEKNLKGLRRELEQLDKTAWMYE